MSRTYIAAALRREVIERAGSCCEYCRTRADDRALDFAIDHVIAEKHGGLTQADNLCLSCYWCNSYKGSDLSSVDWEADSAIVPLFNPRSQVWNDHFQLIGVRLVGVTAHDRVPIALLRLNAVERLKERELLLMLGTYPCLSASQ
ncbi:MAG: HNH endonuclease [Chloroflexi bacterium CFX4]|nr:HNH endonuclease [Chloroflexi bacterium CFX4]MDL1921216.1 HNH endonuclease [Chloroflexi bacterium CFX3]